MSLPLSAGAAYNFRRADSGRDTLPFRTKPANAWDAVGTSDAMAAALIGQNNRSRQNKKSCFIIVERLRRCQAEMCLLQRQKREEHGETRENTGTRLSLSQSQKAYLRQRLNVLINGGESGPQSRTLWAGS
jgi:hypothetical protein